MPSRLRPRATMSLGGLSPRQIAVGMWKRMEQHDAMTWAAAVAFYAMLATVPFLALILVVVVLRLPDLSGAGRRTTGLGHLTVDQLEATLRSLFPNEAYVLVRDQIVRIQNEPPLALLSLGVVISLWSASSLFLVVIDALNRTYGVKETRSFVKLRLRAFAMTLIQAACLLGSLVAIVAWPQILRVLGLEPSGAVAWVAAAVRWTVVFLMVLLSFALTFHVGPNCATSLGLGHAWEPGGNHRVRGLLRSVSTLRPELRQLQQVAGSARWRHGAVVLVLGRGLGALGSGRNGSGDRGRLPDRQDPGQMIALFEWSWFTHRPESPFGSGPNRGRSHRRRSRHSRHRNRGSGPGQDLVTGIG